MQTITDGDAAAWSENERAGARPRADLPVGKLPSAGRAGCPKPTPAAPQSPRLREDRWLARLVLLEGSIDVQARPTAPPSCGHNSLTPAVHPRLRDERSGGRA